MTGSESRKRILVCSLSNADSDPRPNRIVQHLKKEFLVSFLGFESSIHNGDFYLVSLHRGWFKKGLLLLLKVLRLHRLTERIAVTYHAPPNLDTYPLIICHSPELLPFIVSNKGHAKLFFDAREFYPKHFENSAVWRFVNAPFQDYLCKRYLPQITYGTTVSKGLANAYCEEYQVTLDVLLGLPAYVSLSPKKTQPEISLVYHGIATPARELERIVIAMDSVNPGIRLDLMLAGTSKYTEEIKSLAKPRNNVRVIDPVPYEDIVKKLHHYDAGVVFFPPSTFNLNHCMPNKLFEIIQARIAVIASPLADISAFIRQHKIGQVAQSFDAKDLAILINQLTPTQLDDYKHQSDRIARRFCQHTNDERLSAVVRKYL